MQTMIQRLLIASALCLATLTSTAQDTSALAQVKEKGVLRVAVYKDNFPYSYLEQGQMRGLDVDLARALSEQLGVGLSTMNLTASDEAMSDDLRNAIWKGHYLGGGTADVMLHVPIDALFAEANDQVKIFGAYYREQIMIMRDTAHIPELDDLLVFIEQPIGVELETISALFLNRAEQGQLMNNIRHYPAFTTACSALLDGEIAALMAHQAQLEACVQTQPERFALSNVPAPVRLLSWVVGMAVKTGNDDLQKALAQALTELKQNDKLAAIYAAHGVTYSEPPAID
jgi:ABC-type amino acid transport substrate-binding protein